MTLYTPYAVDETAGRVGRQGKRAGRGLQNL